MPMSDLVGSGITDYSQREPGEARNHGHAARFDATDGFVGITQYEGDGKTVTDRVLLSPSQWRALMAFVKAASQPRLRRRP